jgi:heme-degrading monooxygenase HmoA
VAVELVLRVLVFEVGGNGVTVDEALRGALLPRLIGDYGALDAYVGRRAEAALDERVVASVARAGAPAASLEPGGLFAEPDGSLGEPDGSLAGSLRLGRDERLSVRVSIPPGPGERPRVLRLFRGETRAGGIDEYVGAAFAGATSDAATNPGLVSLYLGVGTGDRFVTMSAWTDWSAIEAATGGDVHRPFWTRHIDRLVGFDVRHYELLPDAPRPSGPLPPPLGPETPEGPAT